MTNSAVGMILAAGFGTRLKELTTWRPKPLMELGSRPIIFHQIGMLERAGIRDIYINVHHQAEQIINEIKKWSLKAKIHISPESEILGTAGGIRQVINNFELHHREMMILHGDMMCDVDLATVMQPDSFLSLVIAKNRQLAGYQGSVSVNEQGHITELGAFYSSTDSKAASGFFTGIHFLSKQAVDLLKTTKDSCLVSEVYPEWLKTGKIINGDMRQMLYNDLGTPERLLSTNLSLCESPQTYTHVPFFDHFETRQNIFVGAHVKIDPKASLRGPLILGDHTFIGPDSIVGPKVVVGANCHVSAGAELTNSLLMSGTRIEKDERLDCVIALSKARVLVKDQKDH